MMQSDTLTLASRLGSVLQAAGLLCATAESCTGGLLAGAITSCAGSSQWFERGFVTYSNAAKVDDLGVPSAVLERHGAVSEQTARAMALGVLDKVAAAGLALSTTGIAGPGGATPGKPVGLVCFALARRTANGRQVDSAAHVFVGDRAAVRLASVCFALDMAIRAVDDLNKSARTR